MLRIDGTFTEGKLLRVDKETVTLSNILFGLKTLKRGIDAVAVVVNPATPIDPKISILLHDGSILFAPQYSVKEGHLHLPNHPLQNAPIPLKAIAEIVHGHTPNHVERAEAHWENHSEMGQQFLGDRTRKAMEIKRNSVTPNSDWPPPTNNSSRPSALCPPPKSGTGRQNKTRRRTAVPHGLHRIG